MDISGLVSYDYRPRSFATATGVRQMMTPQDDLDMPPFQEPESSGMATFPSTSFYHPIQASTYQQAMPAYPTDGYPHRGSLDSISRGTQSGAITQGLPNPFDVTTSLSMQTSQSTTVKVEDSTPAYGSQTSFYTGQIVASPTNRIEIGLNAAGTDLDFATDVDTLMKAIQTKAKVISASPISSSQGNGSLATRSQEHTRYPLPGQPEIHSVSSLHDSSADPGDDVADRKAKKRYECDQLGCEKEFFQKTHLEIHMRAHTGVKPFLCKESACGQRFSQLGNLKTHERRHTGERPYQCEVCGKRFAQRGNVRAHKIVHERMKPYICKLEECGKQFTQLGNLKSHQNKFHANVLRELTRRFASIQDSDAVSAADKELWEYFATLYKNSNKGIKGRGKDRRIVGGGDVQSMGFDATAESAGLYNGHDEDSHHHDHHHHQSHYRAYSLTTNSSQSSSPSHASTSQSQHGAWQTDGHTHINAVDDNGRSPMSSTTGISFESLPYQQLAQQRDQQGQYPSSEQRQHQNQKEQEQRQQHQHQQYQHHHHHHHHYQHLYQQQHQEQQQAQQRLHARTHTQTQVHAYAQAQARGQIASLSRAPASMQMQPDYGALGGGYAFADRKMY